MIDPVRNLERKYMYIASRQNPMVTRPQITKDKFSHVMAFPGQASRESGSTLIAIINLGPNILHGSES